MFKNKIIPEFQLSNGNVIKVDATYYFSDIKKSASRIMDSIIYYHENQDKIWWLGTPDHFIGIKASEIVSVKIVKGV